MWNENILQNQIKKWHCFDDRQKNIDVELFSNICKELFFGNDILQGFLYSVKIYISDFLEWKKEHSMIEYAGEKK